MVFFLWEKRTDWCINRLHTETITSINQELFKMIISKAKAVLKIEAQAILTLA